MATLTSKLTLVSTDILPSESLSSSVEEVTNIVAPSTGLSLALAAAAGGSDVEIKSASATATQFVYVRHTSKQADGSTDSDATDELIVKFGSTDTLRVMPGEFAFFPCKSDVAVKIVSGTARVIQVEHAAFTRG
jgi:hypothetical protein